MEKFRYLDHTADLGLEVFGADLPSLFRHAAEGLFDIITDPRTIREKESRLISVEASEREELLIKWLEEFIFLFDTEALLFGSFRITFLDDQTIRAFADGEKYDEARHPIKTVIKGATYHQLKIEQKHDVWTARIIFDL